MVPYKEKVLADAARDLAAKTRKRPKDWLQIFKRFRKMEEHRLRLWHNAGGGGREIARQRSELIDIIFRELYENMAAATPGKRGADRVVVAAFGGYGRREMNPFSDVDIMFLLGRGKPGPHLEEVIRQTLVALWDLGFKVGHSTRSVPQAIKHANEEMLSKTAMLECRFLLGDRELFNEFKDRFQSNCVNGKEDEYIAWRFANQAENRDKYGASVYMQEPNIKNGCGGLRDFQNLLWISYFKHRITTIPKLVDARFLRPSERSRLENGYDFLLRVRTEMHYQNGRAMDGLTLQMQGKVATALRYPQRHILRRCEAFMRDYYQHTRDISQVSAAAIERMQAEPRQKRGLFSFFAPQAKVEYFDGFVARDGMLHAENREIFATDPFRLIRVFQYSQARELNLAPELRDLIRRRTRLIDRTFQYARVTRETFLAILSRKGEVGKVLREMHELGVIGRYIPEFGALTCLVQHEFFHRYTADEHTLVCIEKLDSLVTSDDKKLAGYRTLFQKLEDPAILYLALLLHDTGKAANTKDHESQSAGLAQKVARRLQLSSARRRMLITLVDSHYEMSHTAQTRNLDDPSTITEFSKIVQNRGNLDALMLVTLADGMGTSDESWSDWKEVLVWSLYRQTAEYLEAGPAYFERQNRRRSSVRDEVESVLGKAYAEEVEAHFEYMPERYLLAYEAPEVVEHLHLFHQFFGQRLRDPSRALLPAFKWLARPEQGHSEVWICGWDRARLLEKISGAFLTAGINILSADIFSRGDNLALDIFRVCDSRQKPVTNQKDIQRVQERLDDALMHREYDFSPFFGKESKLRSYRVSNEAELPSRVVVDNSSHPVFTIVEVQTRDRIGLLYSLLRAIGSLDLRIELSRITTEREVALDTFYLLSADSKKVAEAQDITKLQTRLREAVGASKDILTVY